MDVVENAGPNNGDANLDGERGDDDLTADGVIVLDLAGPIQTSSSGDEGGGTCFISINP